MIDSSKWTVIEAGLKCVQGKAVVNSISMKEGEEAFIEHATQGAALRRGRRRDGVRRAGPGGHASSARSRSAQRAYEILTEQVGFPPEDIIFDPNIFAIATGIEEHNGYGVGVHRGDARRSSATLPHAMVSGGVSNVSFSFRGNDPVREAMHSVFLYHAINGGHGHGHRQRRPARDLRGDRAGAARGVSKTWCSTAARTRPSGCSRSPARYKGESGTASARRISSGASCRSRSASSTRSIKGIDDFVVAGYRRGAAQLPSGRCR